MARTRGMTKLYRVFLLLLLWGSMEAQQDSVISTQPAQNELDSVPLMEWSEPVEYEIAGIEIIGAYNSDQTALKSVSGLRVGQKIKVPGVDIQTAMMKLWRLRLFNDVQIIQDKIIGEHIFLKIYLEERARLSRYAYEGAKKSDHEKLNDAVNPFLIKGQIVTEDMKLNAVNAILRHYQSKGFIDTKVNVVERYDPTGYNAVELIFNIDKADRTKIYSIAFEGNENVKDKKLRKAMENTKQAGTLFKKSKLIADDYDDDKRAIIYYYNTLGYRDAEIVADSIYRDEENRLNVAIKIDEGKRYYFRNITWKGNSIYTDERLSAVLGIKKGDIYNEELLEHRLRFAPDGRDVSSLYLDDGYLFFDVTPAEVAVVGDSIDLQMRIFEGPQATIDKVIIEGNDRTHEHVIRREVRTRPGQKFSRSDIIRSQRQIINLGYFDAEQLDIQTPVDPQRGTVDIVYKVVERPSDQLELSAGWGGFGRSSIIGTLGMTFNNFSLRNIFNREAWHPLPQGDGQRLSIRAQTNGEFYQSYNFSFTEPWLGGKKPTSLTVGAVHTSINNEFYQGGRLKITRGYVGIGTRLTWPDDNFVFNATANIENINLNNYATGDFRWNDQIVRFGSYNNYYLTLALTRTTINEPIFPRSGSRIGLTAQLTPPYTTVFGREIQDITDPQDALKWVEYHKWRFDAEWYASLGPKIVVKAAVKMGFLGYYNPEIGTPPFERFELGGDGISNQQFGIVGKDIISLRGYEIGQLAANAQGGAAVFNKLTMEVRYPIALQPSSTIFVLSFLEGGNSWLAGDTYDPFDLKRSAGFGLRVFLPMFGLLGFDYGWGWDKPLLNAVDARPKEYGRFSVILGFEPD